MNGSAGERETLALALDIGGTKIAAAVVDVHGRVQGRIRCPAPKTPDPEVFFAAVSGCGEQAMRAVGVTSAQLAGVGCGCGGPMRWPAGDVSPINIPAWRDFPLRRRVMEEFDGLPTLVHNDAVALVAGEHWCGSGKGIRNMLSMTVSTGVGGGLILGGRLFHGSTGNAGHVGHIIVAPDGPLCDCGAQGCLEAVASGPNTVRYALGEGWQPAPGTEPDGRALARAAAGGDEVAVRALERAGSAVGLALASCAATLDLEVTVLAGGFSQSGPPFWRALRSSFSRYAVLPFARSMRIVESEMPDEFSLLGAASFVLVPESYGWRV